MISRYLPAALALCAMLGGTALVHAKEPSKEAEHENTKSSETAAEDKESLSPRHLSCSALSACSLTAGTPTELRSATFTLLG